MSRTLSRTPSHLASNEEYISGEETWNKRRQSSVASLREWRAWQASIAGRQAEQGAVIEATDLSEKLQSPALSSNPESSHKLGADDAKEGAAHGEPESEVARIERLGRERPAKFASWSSELGFCFCIIMSQVLTEYFVSGFLVVLPTVASELNIPPASQTWPANAFSLTIACFLLFFGRLADMYGGYVVYTGGLAWLAVWSFICGWSQNEVMIDMCRAIAGLGPSAYLPSGLMLLGSVYRPGPRKNFIFSVYGACAAFGFYVGIFFAGVTAQFTTWRWFFFIGSILAAITAVASFFAIPSDRKERRDLGIKMDWLGAIMISTGLILVVFAITDSSHAPHGWATPYIYVLLPVGLILLATAIYVEGWVAEQPLLPLDLFATKHMKPLIISLLFLYGSFGIFLLYATLYMTNIMGATPLQLVAWYSPLAIGGLLIGTFGGLVLHILPGTVLILFSGICWVLTPLLFALSPIEGANYWAWVFPSMIASTLAIDITFNVANIFITTSLPLKQQGLAGALINSILQLGIAIFLGFADIVAVSTADQGEAKSYKNVFWFEVGIAGAAFLLLLGRVRLNKAGSDLTVDEKAELVKDENTTNISTASTAATSPTKATAPAAFPQTAPLA